MDSIMGIKFICLIIKINFNYKFKYCFNLVN